MQSVRSLQPHGGTTTGHNGTVYTFTHHAGAYAADQRKPFSEQRLIYVPSEAELQAHAVRELAEDDARFALQNPYNE
jgi:hypothetical protein